MPCHTATRRLKPALATLGLGLLALLAMAGPLEAQQFEQVGDYQIHYSAVSTQFIPPSVAEAHGIQRSPAMALVNVSVLQADGDGALRPVNAPVSGSVGVVRGGSQTPLAFRTLRDGDTQSQIAVFRIQEDEPMHFDLQVNYDRNQEPADLRFIQRFYIER